MQLLTKTLLERFDNIGNQSLSENPLILARYVDSRCGFSWYMTSFDPIWDTFTGYKAGHEKGEWNSFCLHQMEAYRNGVYRIERDFEFQECHFFELLEKLGKSYPEDQQISPLREKLQDIGYNELHTIKGFVANFLNESSSDDEELKCLIYDIMSHGCISGAFTDLIYYAQTHNFFEKYYDEITMLRSHIEEDMGLSLKLGFGTKNSLAWLATEQIMSELASELEIDM